MGLDSNYGNKAIFGANMGLPYIGIIDTVIMLSNVPISLDTCPIEYCIIQVCS
jgi:hypothetical protein